MKFPSEISDLAFSRAGASLAISSKNAYFVFHRITSTGCFIPKLRDVGKDVTHVVESLAWKGPMIEHKRPKLQPLPFRTNVYDSWKVAQDLTAAADYTFCEHWKLTTKCDCPAVEADYNRRKDVKISREVKDDSGKFLAIVRGCWVEIWSTDHESMGTVGEKDEPTTLKRKMGEALRPDKLKQSKVQSLEESSNNDSGPKAELIEITIKEPKTAKEPKTTKGPKTTEEPKATEKLVEIIKSIEK